jgi:hypothetical protein
MGGRFACSVKQNPIDYSMGMQHMLLTLLLTAIFVVFVK